ncbi:unnamed protein product, partial [Prorocentrum cordatum]
RELERLVSSGFPFSEAEAARNAEYRASPTMRAWQKGFGCAGGDTGEEGNFFSRVYARLFDHRVEASSSPPGPSRFAPVRVLEVGVCDGSAVAMWSEYFEHPDSRIVAMDVSFLLFGGNRPYLVQRGFDLSRLSAIIEANASDPAGGALLTANWSMGDRARRMATAKALRLHGPFDFIRDDASHTPSDMIATFQWLFLAALRPGGVYAVEDVGTYSLGSRGSLDESGEFSYFFRLARDSLNFRYDAVTDRWMATSWIQSLRASPLEAWVDSVEFSRGLIVVRKRGEHSSPG